MAKQIGIVNFRGSIGDITFVKTEDGYHVRRKSSLDKARVLSDHRFENSRRTSNEFSSAARAGKLMRQAIIGTLKNAGDSRLHSRMLKRMSEILQTDMISGFGERKPENGTLKMLEGFEFNNKNALNNTFVLGYRSRIDRPAGMATIDFPDFSPETTLIVPEGANYFSLLSAATELDFINYKSKLSTDETDYLPLDTNTIPGFSLAQPIDSAGNLPVILVLGIRFYKEVNGKYGQLYANGFNALRILAVDQL